MNNPKLSVDEIAAESSLEAPLHGILARQLKKMNLEYNSLPQDTKQWQQLLDKINRTYNESDHDKYRLERSMSISSKEITDLNSKLIHAQSIAAMGYWLYKTDGDLYWSNDCINVLGREFTSANQNYNQFLAAVDENERENIEKEVDQILEHGGKANFEIQIGEKWFHFMLVNDISTGSKDNLTEDLTGIVMDVTLRKEYELEVDKLNKQLISSAREVGRADISTSVLHNIGNVLNSVNASIGLLSETLENDHVDMLKLAANKLHENANYSDYLSKDKKGKLLPEYIKMQTEELTNKNNLIKKECSQLVEYISHIKSIIKSQQSWAKTSTVKTYVNISEIINASLRMTGINFANHQIKIIVNCFFDREFACDESKLTQIVVNLLCNAKDAIKMYYDANNVAENGEIIVDVRANQDTKMLEISVTDNGIGISAESLEKIFNFGYTSKVEGHGFGLHSSILAAKEMNGNLVASSRGVNRGATFILNLPLE